MLSVLLAELDVCKAEIASLRSRIHVDGGDDTDEVGRLRDVCKSALNSAEHLKVSRSLDVEVRRFFWLRKANLFRIIFSIQKSMRIKC